MAQILASACAVPDSDVPFRPSLTPVPAVGPRLIKSQTQIPAGFARSDKSPATTLDLLNSDQMKQVLEIVAAISKIKAA